MNKNGVLLLNSSYEPLRIIGIERAFYLYFKDRVYIEEYYMDKVYHSPNKQWQVPSVIRLKTYRNIFKKRRETAKKRHRIYIRDKFRCLYCGLRGNERTLTLDHIIPKAQGGQDYQENLATCCLKCNQYKADRTPEQARMELRKTPKELSVGLDKVLIKHYGEMYPNWKKYLFLNDQSEGDTKFIEYG